MRPEIIDQSSKDQVRISCIEAMKYGFASIVVRPCYVELAKKELRNSLVKVGSVFSFPYGDISINSKVFQIKELISFGADCIDGPINFPLFRSGKMDYIREEIDQIVAVARNEKKDIEIKFIIEAGSLTREEIVLISKIIKESGADFVKTTGMVPCTTEHVKTIRETVGPDFGVKTYTTDILSAIAMIESGANRLGIGPLGFLIMEGYDVYKKILETKNK